MVPEFNFSSDSKSPTETKYSPESKYSQRFYFPEYVGRHGLDKDDARSSWFPHEARSSRASPCTLFKLPTRAILPVLILWNTPLPSFPEVLDLVRYLTVCASRGPHIDWQGQIVKKKYFLLNLLCNGIKLDFYLKQKYCIALTNQLSRSQFQSSSVRKSSSMISFKPQFITGWKCV